MKILVKGNEALIDKEDKKLFDMYTWHLSHGYILNRSGWKVKVNTYYHRLVMGLPDKKYVVDHINGNKLDNRKKNLRICTHMENTHNHKLSSASTTGYTGVSWSKVANKYHAYIRADGARRHLGYFNDIQQAAKAYNKAARKYRGEFARLNIIKEES